MPLLLCRHLDRRIDWKVEVAEGDFTIGYSDVATVPVPDATLAPREVAILKKGERYLLQDLAEKGRVVLGGAITRTGLLKDRDRFRVGRIAILFLEQADRAQGQIELSRETPATFDLLESSIPQSSKRHEPPVREDEIPRGVWVGVLVLALFSGLCLGILVWGPPRDSTALGPDISGSADSAKDRTSASPAAGDSARTSSLPQEPHVRVSDVPNGRASSGEASAQKLAPPERFAIRPLSDARASRLVLFRLFIDLASRPPTRSEERELMGQDHEARVKRVIEVARREGSLPDLRSDAETQFLSLIGRKPTRVELTEIATLTTEDRPAAFWITALEEYRRPDRRRPRSSLVRARSFYVDLLDREPSDAQELEAVRSALAARDSSQAVARTLIHSAKGRQTASADGGSDWETEAFRFLLRDPTPAERSEVARVWESLDPAGRRAWLLLALASHEDYGKY